MLVSGRPYLRVNVDNSDIESQGAEDQQSCHYHSAVQLPKEQTWMKVSVTKVL